MLATLLTIAVLHWVVLLVPGFNFVLIGQLAAGGSRSRAFSAVAGMTLATLNWALLAVLGVGVVLSAVAMVFLNSVAWHSFLALVLSQPVVQRAYLRHVHRLNQLCAAVVGAFGLRLLLATLSEWRARA